MAACGRAHHPEPGLHAQAHRYPPPQPITRHSDADIANAHRLYHDLAWLWPHLSPPDHYVAEAAHLDALLTEHLGPGPHRILELGAGGGHTLVHLDPRGGRGGRHTTVAADLSAEMLRTPEP